MAGPPRFDGLRVIVVEDESPVAMLIEDILDGLGCSIVGAAGNLEKGVALAEAADFDLALLDVNLAGESAWPVAAAVDRRGLPFAFVTGYGSGSVPVEFRGRPTVGKPFRAVELAAAIAAATGRRGSG